ncbi:MAG: hypothetical protein NTV97_01645 [Alphaproteobacteria bacterium]|nr:hypothetical protein [Alphaproteobacteria bacterium]
MIDCDAFRRVAEKLSQIGHWRYQANLTPETEIYRDLHIYGMDMAELIWWASKEFEIQGTVDIGACGPPEVTDPLAGLWNSARKLLGFGKKQYKSFTVRDVLASIEAKRWILRSS